MPTPTKRRGGPTGPAPTPCPSSPMNPPSIRHEAGIRPPLTADASGSLRIRLDLLLGSDCLARSWSPTPRVPHQRRATRQVALSTELATMPRLSAFYGIAIFMYWDDHEPRHLCAARSPDRAGRPILA